MNHAAALILRLAAASCARALVRSTRHPMNGRAFEQFIDAADAYDA